MLATFFAEIKEVVECARVDLEISGIKDCSRQ